MFWAEGRRVLVAFVRQGGDCRYIREDSFGIFCTATASNIGKLPGEQKPVEIRPGTQTVNAAVKGAGIGGLGS